MPAKTWDADVAGHAHVPSPQVFAGPFPFLFFSFHAHDMAQPVTIKLSLQATGLIMNDPIRLRDSGLGPV